MQEEEVKIHSNITKACSRTSNKELMLCGDFTHNTTNWKELEAMAEGQAFLYLTHDLGLIQHVATTTRHGNVLDLVLTTTPNLVRDVHVTEPFGSSDHNIVEFTMVYRTKYIDFQLANFQLADFQLIDFQFANLQSTNFQFANFQLANFQLTNFQFANLQTSNLQTSNSQTSNSQTSNVQNFNKQNFQFANFQLINLETSKVQTSNSQPSNS